MPTTTTLYDDAAGRSRREQIQAVAEQLFRDKGYLATSMRDIASQLQMKGGGSLYAHIKGKEELLWDIANKAMDVFVDALQPILENDNLPTFDKLRQAMITHMLVIMQHLSASAVYFDEWRHLSAARREAFLERRDSYERRFEQLLCALNTETTIKVFDVRLATLHLFGTMNSLRHWYQPTGRLSALAVAEQIAEMILNGLNGC